MSLVKSSAEGPVGRITLADPARRNALSRAMISALETALASQLERAEVRAIVLDAEGSVFCAGHDIKEMQAHRADPDHGRAFGEDLFNACARLMAAIARAPKPVIAAIEGVATAAGCQLAASCDLAVAGAQARFATPGVGIGLFCSTPMVALTRTLAPKHAMELLLTGEMVDAPTAYRMGLVNRVTEPGQALDEARAFAQRIAARSSEAIAFGKPAFHAQAALDLEAAYSAASRVMVENLMAGEADEGMAAFLEKRAPSWAAPDAVVSQGGKRDGL